LFAKDTADITVRDGETVNLPHSWNATDGQDGGSDYFRGACLYAKTIKKAELPEADCYYLEIRGANSSADVYVGGEKLAHHDGGYSAFRTELSGHLAETNILAVSVNNADSRTVYPQKADFTFYGGLYRPVSLITVSEEHFELLKDGTPGIKVTPVVDLEKKCAHVTVETWHNGNSVEITVNGETKTAENKAGEGVHPVRGEGDSGKSGVYGGGYRGPGIFSQPGGDGVCPAGSL
jgi:beta-galactosidase